MNDEALKKKKKPKMNEEALERKLDRKQMKKERKGKKSDHCAQNVIRS